MLLLRVSIQSRRSSFELDYRHAPVNGFHAVWRIERIEWFRLILEFLDIRNFKGYFVVDEMWDVFEIRGMEEG